VNHRDGALFSFRSDPNTRCDRPVTLMGSCSLRVDRVNRFAGHFGTSFLTASAPAVHSSLARIAVTWWFAGSSS